MYVEDDSVKFFELLLVFEIFGCEIFGEVGLAHIGDCFVEGEPIQFLYQFLDVVSIEIGCTIDAFLDLDNERKVVFFAFGDIADEQIVGKQPHSMLNYDYKSKSS